MILRGTVFITLRDTDMRLEPAPFPRAVLQEDAHDASGFQAQVIARVRAKFARRQFDIEFGPIGIPWSHQ